MEVTEEIKKLLKQGKTPKELIEMGYARSTVYHVVKELNEEEQRKGLLDVVRQLVHRKKGSLEIAVGHLVFEALAETNHLKVIDKVCRAYHMLDEDEKEMLLSREELEELRNICTINTALLNAYRDKEESEYHVLIPLPSNEVLEHMKFLEKDPDYFSYIGWHVIKETNFGNKVKSIGDKIKKRLFLGVTGFSYHALISYFVNYALPTVMKALRRLIDVVDPHAFKEVVLHGSNMVKGERESKLHKT